MPSQDIYGQKRFDQQNHYQEANAVKGAKM